MRSFSRSDWEAAQQAWADGDFSDEWREYRHLAAMRGIIFPPEGTRWDNWEDAAPSQRAMLIRAIRETPGLMAGAIGRSRSWGDVIAWILSRRDEWRADMADRERHEAALREDEPTGREATVALKALLTRISDS